MRDLEDLKAVTEARYRQQQQSFQKIVAEETHLRSELARLDQHLQDTRHRADQDRSMKAIGADIIWQGWVGQRKTELNMKLARVLAMKQHHLTQVRAAYGKLNVTEKLLDDAREEKRKKMARLQLHRAIDQSLF